MRSACLRPGPAVKRKSRLSMRCSGSVFFLSDLCKSGPGVVLPEAGTPGLLAAAPGWGCGLALLVGGFVSCSQSSCVWKCLLPLDMLAAKDTSHTGLGARGIAERVWAECCCEKRVGFISPPSRVGGCGSDWTPELSFSFGSYV